MNPKIINDIVATDQPLKTAECYAKDIRSTLIFLHNRIMELDAVKTKSVDITEKMRIGAKIKGLKEAFEYTRTHCYINKSNLIK